MSKFQVILSAALLLVSAQAWAQAEEAQSSSATIVGFSFDSSGCPAGFPLYCGNGQCCPAGSTLYCPQLAPTPCVNPSRLTSEQLKLLSDNCHPLLSCN